MVFVTRYRHGVFTKAVPDDLKKIFAGVRRNFEAELAGFDEEDNHARPPVVCQPKVSGNSLKCVSSGLTGKKGCPSIQKNSGTVLSDHQAIPPGSAKERRFLSRDSILNPGDSQLKTGIPVKALPIPALKGGDTGRV
ncbi:transposase [uncultured Desulfovibrio sp.]|uniref:transposase n=1 Tax=uncultured Desulfovibrio sp. TaxID=167968 RepID=UPI0026055997|nr:transposase [uncultured Desulfovibrio sp.]